MDEGGRRPPDPGKERIPAVTIARHAVVVFRVHNYIHRRWRFRGGTTTHGHEIAAAAEAAWAPASTMGFGFVGSTGPLIIREKTPFSPGELALLVPFPLLLPLARPFPLPWAANPAKTCRHRMGGVGVSRQKWPGGTARNEKALSTAKRLAVRLE